MVAGSFEMNFNCTANWTTVYVGAVQHFCTAFTNKWVLAGHQQAGSILCSTLPVLLSYMLHFCSTIPVCLQCNTGLCTLGPFIHLQSEKVVHFILLNIIAIWGQQGLYYAKCQAKYIPTLPKGVLHCKKIQSRYKNHLGSLGLHGPYLNINDKRICALP